jgi:hypothetical protein
VATVVDGTPIVSVPTPVPISTVEYRAVRRSYGLSSDTPDVPQQLFGQQLEGFQFNYAVDSVAGTPRPPHRNSASYDSSFDLSGLHDDELAGAVRAAVAMPLPAEEEGEDHMSRMFGPAVGETPRQLSQFRETFNSIDWLATYTESAGQEGAVEEGHSLPTALNTERSVLNEVGGAVPRFGLDSVRTVLDLPLEAAEAEAPGQVLDRAVPPLLLA